MKIDFVNTILSFKWFILSEMVIAGLMLLVVFVATRKFDWSSGSIRVFGGFFNLDDAMTLSLGLIFTRYIFIVSSIVFRVTMKPCHLMFIMLVVLVFNLLRRDFVGLLVDIVNYAVIFGALMVGNMFERYIYRVGMDIPVLLVYIFMAIFVILHSTYYSLVAVDKVLGEGREKNPHRELSALVKVRKALGIKSKKERALLKIAKMEEKKAKAEEKSAKALEKKAKNKGKKAKAEIIKEENNEE